MKTYIHIIFVALLFSFTGCSEDVGPEGPPGPPGSQGPVGPTGAQGESGFVFEWEQVNFEAPNYEAILGYPDDFEGFDSDVALVYLLWDVQEVDGVDTEIWRALPQTVITNDGILQYNFDFSKFDVRLFLDAQFSFDNLTSTDTDNWVVRVVVVPGSFWNGRTKPVDYSDYNQVKEAFGLPELEKHSNIIRRK